MKILAIDASTEACSAALLINKEIHEIFNVAPMQHTQLLLPMVQQLLVDASIHLSQLDAIAFGCGPGSFTGIRIAASMTQGLAVNHQIPVVPVSTLLALAQSAYEECHYQKIIPCLDARMNELYWACCEINNDELMTFVTTEQCTVAAEIQIPNTQYFGVGEGWAVNNAEIKKLAIKLLGINPQIYPHAKSIIKLAAKLFTENKVVTPENALPVYVREMNYKKSEKK